MTTTATVTLHRIKVLPGYAAHARFLYDMATAGETRPERYDAIGSIPRQEHIPSPYAYSPVHSVYDWHGVPVVIVETRHRRYEVFRVDGPIDAPDV